MDGGSNMLVLYDRRGMGLGAVCAHHRTRGSRSGSFSQFFHIYCRPSETELTNVRWYTTGRLRAIH